MSIPDFERADYIEPQIIDAEPVVLTPVRAGAFPLALLYGSAAAVVGCIGYALVASMGFMISIVAIGIAWLIAKAMMTASHGIGGRPYQIAAVILTYLAVSVGEVASILYREHPGHVTLTGLAYVFFRYGLTMPFLELQGSFFNGILGIIILFIGLRAAWRLAAGSPGFSGGSGPRRRVDPFGLR